MIKVCEECGGLGYERHYIGYDADDDLKPWVDLCCDNCQGEGFMEVKSSKFFLKIYKDKKIKTRTYLEIETTMNRPNNPDDIEIIEAWVMYNYGVDTFDLEEIDQKIEVLESWNIENYR